MTTIWIGIYDHKYGTDVCAYATEELAYRGLASTTIEQLACDPSFEDAPEEDLVEIHTAFNEGRWLDAIRGYEALANGWGNLDETMSVEPSTLVEE